MRILLVEDSQRLQKAISTGLHKSGYAADVSGDGEEGLWMAESNEYDAIVLDLMLPKMDGLTVLERLREQGAETPILILTAMDAVEDRVSGLQKGADDYLVKPFAFAELLARIQTLIRRGHGKRSPEIKVGDLRINTSSRAVWFGDMELSLAPREFALLELLALRKGEIVTRPQIESHIYDDRVEPNSNVVDAAIYALRKKLERPGRASPIKTRRGMGYLLQEDRK